MAGFMGAFIIAMTSVILLPFCSSKSQSLGESILSSRDSRTGFQGGRTWGLQEKVFWVIAVTLIGGLGSLVDSVLGAVLQRSVVEVRTGKVIEGDGGKQVILFVIHTENTKLTRVTARYQWKLAGSYRLRCEPHFGAQLYTTKVLQIHLRLVKRGKRDRGISTKEGSGLVLKGMTNLPAGGSRVGLG